MFPDECTEFTEPTEHGSHSTLLSIYTILVRQIRTFEAMYFASDQTK